MLSNNGSYLRTACAVGVTIFSTGGKFQLVSTFMKLHAFPQATHSYALLLAMANIHPLQPNTMALKNHAIFSIEVHQLSFKEVMSALVFKPHECAS